jgi:uncharacterized protein YndB with AHSA1/START domain
MDWPLETLSTVTFFEHQGQTTVTMQGLPYNATDAQRETFENFHASMQNGWGGTFEKLTGYIEGSKA